MLTTFSGETWLASASKVVDFVDAVSAVFTRVLGTVVDVGFAAISCPAWVTDALVVEQFVDAEAVLAWIATAQVDFVLAALSCKSGRTGTTKIGN